MIYIQWGKIYPTKFENIVKLEKFDPSYRAGLYVIMAHKGNGENGISSFRVLYFGQSKNLSERGFPKNHTSYDCWVSQAEGCPLYVATHLMPNSTKENREKLEYSLINDYNLVCNKKKG
ncbi:MAG: hypothetical protein WC337_10570 [Candidatus Muiribacteriota bacterium]